MNKQSLIYTVIFTFIVSFFFVLLLSFANEGTREQVALNQQVRRQQAILNALGISYEGPQDVLTKFEAVEEVSRGEERFYRTTIDGRQVFAKEFNGSGLWGNINGILAVDEGVNQTVGMEIISHNETPGLGGRIDEPWFKEQLRGETIVNGTIRIGDAGEGDEDSGNGTIDAVTGATRTSDAMQVILNNELATIADALGGNS